MGTKIIEIRALKGKRPLLTVIDPMICCNEDHETVLGQDVQSSL